MRGKLDPDREESQPRPSLKPAPTERKVRPDQALNHEELALNHEEP